MGAKKNFVLDTNVILHDYKCIENFQENDISKMCRMNYTILGNSWHPLSPDAGRKRSNF